MATLRVALPYYDTGGVSAYHLGYLTDGQPVHTSLKYHRIHVVELAALDSIEPNATLELYHDRWAAYPPAPVPVSAPPVVPPVSPPPTSTSAAMPTSAFTRTGCRYAGHRVRRRGVSCRRARRVLRAYLRRHRELRRWHCHRGARIVCRRYTHRVSIAAPRAT
jgi:hypothetical protein